MVKEFTNYCIKLKEALDNLQQDNINDLYSEIKLRINTNSTIFLIGNGGSAANADHISGDYTKTFLMLGLKLNIISASESNCYLTATSNDIDFSEVYSTMVGIKIVPNDLIIYLSGSGNSINLVKCAQKTKNYNIKQAGVLGYSGGRLKDLVDISIHVKINDMEISEDVQLIIFHYMKQKFCNEYSDNKNQVSNKYDKRVIEDIVS